MIKSPPTPHQLTLQLDELPELIAHPYEDLIFEPVQAVSLESPPDLELEPVVELKLQPTPELILELDTNPILSIRIRQSKKHRRNGAPR